MTNNNNNEYTIKEYAELKGYKLKQETRKLLGRNAEKIEKSGRYIIEKKWKHEDGMFLRGKYKQGKWTAFKRQPGVRIWTLEILEEVFHQ